MTTTITPAIIPIRGAVDDEDDELDDSSGGICNNGDTVGDGVGAHVPDEMYIVSDTQPLLVVEYRCQS